MDSLGCQRCYQLQAQIAQLQEKIRILTEQLQRQTPSNEVMTKNVVNLTLQLLLDPTSTPSDLNKINVPELANELLDFEDFAKELLGCSNSSKVVGFLIFLKGKDPLLAFKISEILVLKQKTFAVPDKVIDSLKKLFPEIQTPQQNIEEALVDQKLTKVRSSELAEFGIPDSDPVKALSRAKLLLADLLEQTFSDSIDSQIFEKIRLNLLVAGTEMAYEEFIRDYLWGQFPKNLESSFGRNAFKALIELLEYIMEIFKHDEIIYRELQSKLILIRR